MTIEDECDRSYVAQIFEQNKLKLYIFKSKMEK